MLHSRWISHNFVVFALNFAQLCCARAETVQWYCTCNYVALALNITQLCCVRAEFHTTLLCSRWNRTMILYLRAISHNYVMHACGDRSYNLLAATWKCYIHCKFVRVQTCTIQSTTDTSNANLIQHGASGHIRSPSMTKPPFHYDTMQQLITRCAYSILGYSVHLTRAMWDAVRSGLKRSVAAPGIRWPPAEYA